MRPLLGISACNVATGDETAARVIHRYIAPVARHADAVVVLVPSIPGLQSADELAARLDGFLLTGSPSNVAPARYGDAAPGDGPFDPARDTTTLALIEAFERAEKPVWAVCRGIQEVNVAFGGTLRRGVVGHHAPAGATLDEMFAFSHSVALPPGGVFARAFGVTEAVVNSVHFQAIDRLGAELRVEATAADGTIEAVSADLGGADLLAVQWHPEWQTDANPQSQAFFRLLGRALRGQRLYPIRKAA